MTNISVHSRDLGWLTEAPITAQSFITIDGDRELEWCNHAAAELVIETVEIPRQDEADLTYPVSLWICDKCPAYRDAYNSIWYDAPASGVDYERTFYER